MGIYINAMLYRKERNLGMVALNEWRVPFRLPLYPLHPSCSLVK